MKTNLNEEIEYTIKDKCKRAQKEFDFRLDCDKPIVVHIDGKNFSKLIKKKFKRPFDEDFIDMMNKTAQFLCQNVQGVKMAYTQSDEISLLIWKTSPDSEIPFGGRLCKLQSIIAALATSEFNKYYILNSAFNYDDWSGVGISDIYQNVLDMKLAQFDCKVWNVDNIDDAFLWILFRNIDCVRNSKQQTAQTYIPSKQLKDLSADEQIEKLLEEKNIDWNKLSSGEKWGRFILKDDVAYENELITYHRKQWSVFDGSDLTNADNRLKLREQVEKSLKIEE